MVDEERFDYYIPLVPYMPIEPRAGYGYVPYQINPHYFENSAEAFQFGTVYPELVTPYFEYLDKGVPHEH
jgi:peptidase E